MDWVRVRHETENAPWWQWDSVSPTWRWISGIRPRYATTKGGYSIELGRGEYTIVALKEDEMLVLVSTKRALDPRDYPIETANGRGIFLTEKWQSGNDARSLVYRPKEKRPALVKVARNADRDGVEVETIELFVLRRLKTVEVPAYKESVQIGWGTGRKTKKIGSHDYFLLPKNATVKLKVDQLTRIRIISRLIYEALDSKCAQRYRVVAGVSDRRKETVIHSTTTDIAMDNVCSRKGEVLGLAQTAYYEVPPGAKTIRLRADASIYCCVHGEAENSYLLPEMNSIFKKRDMLWGKKVADTKQVFKNLIIPNWEVYTKFEKLVDFENAEKAVSTRNDLTDSGQASFEGMKFLAVSFGNNPEIWKQANKIDATRCMYVNVLPEYKISTDSPLVGNFVTQRPWSGAWIEGDEVICVSERYVEDMANRYGRGIFNRVPLEKDGFHTYRLRTRAWPSRLRLLIASKELKKNKKAGSIFVQYEEASPIKLRVQSTGIVNGRVPGISISEAGLRLLKWKALQGEGRGVHWGGAVGHVIDVAFIELSLPATVSTVKIWKCDNAPGDLKAALQFRVSKQFRLTEREFLNYRNDVGDDVDIKKWFEESLGLYETRAKRGAFGEKALRNELFSLIRRMREEEGRFSINNYKRNKENQGSGSGSGPEEMRAASTTLEESKTEKNLIRKLELLTEAVEGSYGEVWAQAELERAKCLLRLGDDNRARRALKTLIGSQAGNSVRAESLQVLKGLYKKSNDILGWRRICLAVAAIETSDENCRELISALVEAGEYRDALLLGLLRYHESVPTREIVKCSLKERWWRTFEASVGRLDDRKERKYWRAHGFLARGRHEEALDEFIQSGEIGNAYSELIKRAAAIQKRLKDDSVVVRSKAILDWENWHTDLPGPYIWRSQPEIFVDYENSYSVYSARSNKHLQYFKASEQRPIKLRLLGPAYLKLGVRPLHYGKSKKPVDGWLKVDGQFSRDYVPITANTPAEGISIVGQSQLFAGGLVTFEHYVGRGVHEVTLSAGEVDVLARIFVRESELPIGILPPYNLRAIRKAYAGLLFAERREGFNGATRGKIELLREGKRRVSLLVAEVSVADENVAEGDLDTSTLPEELAERIAIRINMEGVREKHTGLDLLTMRENGLPADEAAYMLYVQGRLDKYFEKPAWVYRSLLDHNVERGFLLKKGLFKVFLDMPLPKKPEEIVKRMFGVVYVSELGGELSDIAVHVGEELFWLHRQIPAVKQAHKRLARSLQWKKNSEISGGIGSSYRSIKGWSPESKEGKIKRALLRDLRKHERTITPGEKLRIALEANATKSYEIVFRSEKSKYRSPGPLVVAYAVDSNSVRYVSVPTSSEEKSALEILKKGTHTIEVWLDKPDQGPGCRVAIYETQGSHTLGKRGLPVEQQIIREYSVASHERPLVVSVTKPSWLRIDKRKGEYTESTYYFARNRFQEIELIPDDDENEALYRVFQRSRSLLEDPGEVEEEHTETVADFEIAPGQIPELKMSSQELLSVENTAGGLQVGTWSLASSVVRKKAIDEDALGLLKPDLYFELAAKYRVRSQGTSFFSATGLSCRIHEVGGPSFGVDERVIFNLKKGMRIQLDGSFIAQFPGGSVLQVQGTPEWLGRISGKLSTRVNINRKAWHRPAIQLFGRALSLDDGDPEAFLVTDQDVYTNYKSKHRMGVVLSDAVYYKPWLDTMAAAKVELRSNEDLNVMKPDSIALKLGLAQRLGSFQVNASFRMTNYFKDSDRNRDSLRYVVGVGVEKELWICQGQRIQVHSNWKYDIERADSSFQLGLVWHFADRSGYRDYSDEELTFRNLRKQSMFKSLSRTD